VRAHAVMSRRHVRTLHAVRGRAAVTAAALAILVGCSSGQESAARRAADRHYVDGVHNTATDIGSYRTDSQLIKLGHAVCDGYRAHASTQQIADLLERTSGGRSLPSEDLGAVISTAVADLCPAYASRLNPASTSG
jgi:hypothetical protein